MGPQVVPTSDRAAGQPPVLPISLSLSHTHTRAHIDNLDAGLVTIFLTGWRTASLLAMTWIIKRYWI
jgi:hypothetical protein